MILCFWPRMICQSLQLLFFHPIRVQQQSLPGQTLEGSRKVGELFCSWHSETGQNPPICWLGLDGWSLFCLFCLLLLLLLMMMMMMICFGNNLKAWTFHSSNSPRTLSVSLKISLSPMTRACNRWRLGWRPPLLTKLIKLSQRHGTFFVAQTDWSEGKSWKQLKSGR